MTSTLLHFDGVNGSANFFDEVSQTDLPINGTPNVSSIGSKFGGSSGHFTNDGQILVSASQFVAGNDWCIEGFIFTESGTDGSSIANVQVPTNAFNMFHDSNVSCRLLIGGSNAISGIVTPSDEWFHLAIVKSGTTITVYMNGTSAGTTTVAATYVPPADIYIGGHPSVGSHAFNGFIDEFRITNDEAVYLSDFTPPVHAFHLNEISARYWRLVNITLPGGASHLEVSQIEFYDNNEVSTNAGVTVTSSNVPTQPIANLADSNLNTRCYWSAVIAQDENFFIQYDFGSAQTVTKMRQAGFDNSTRFIESCEIQYSNDGVNWETAALISGNTYPGNNTFSPFFILNPLPPSVTYSIAGNAKIDGVNQPCVIRAYRVDNGELAATIVADGVTGDYVLDNLEDGTEYYVMCIPPSGQSTVCPQANGAFLPATDGNATAV